MKSITIVIPAYNEALNIERLLTTLLAQKVTTAKVTGIWVMSDGSTDQTTSLVKKIAKRHPVVTLKGSAERKGKGPRLNQAFSQAKTDAVVVVDGDIEIRDAHFIEILVQPLWRDAADLVAAKIDEVTPQTLMQKILHASMDWKRAMFGRHLAGANVYTCHGRARAFSQKMYQHFRIAFSSSEDSESFFYAQTHGLTYVYAPEAVAYYRLPLTLADHKKQSLRYFNSKDHGLVKYHPEVVRQAYQLPFSLQLTTLLEAWIKHPILLSLYIGILMYIKACSLIQKTDMNTWAVATSSKGVA